MIDEIFSNYSYLPFLPLPRQIGLQWMDEGKEDVCVWWVWSGVLSPGFGGELDEPLLEPTGIKGRTVRPKHCPLLCPSPLLTPIVFASLSYLIRHPLTSICNSNENQTPTLPISTPSLPFPATTTRRQRRKAAEIKASGIRRLRESPHQKRDIMLLEDEIVRWPSEVRLKKKSSLSFCVATIEVFSYSERVTIWCWLSNRSRNLITPTGGLISGWSWPLSSPSMFGEKVMVLLSPQGL